MKRKYKTGNRVAAIAFYNETMDEVEMVETVLMISVVISTVKSKRRDEFLFPLTKSGKAHTAVKQKLCGGPIKKQKL